MITCIKNVLIDSFKNPSIFSMVEHYSKNLKFTNALDYTEYLIRFYEKNKEQIHVGLNKVLLDEIEYIRIFDPKQQHVFVTYTDFVTLTLFHILYFSGFKSKSTKSTLIFPIKSLFFFEYVKYNTLFISIFKVELSNYLKVLITDKIHNKAYYHELHGTRLMKHNYSYVVILILCRMASDIDRSEITDYIDKFKSIML